MGEFRYLLPEDNLILNSTVTSVNQDSNYPRDNVKLSDPQKEFRFNNDNADRWIQFNLGSPAQPTLAAFFGHNFIGIDSITWESDDNTGMTSPSEEAVISMPVASPAFYRINGSPQNHQHQRFTLDGTNGANGRIGEMGLGVSRVLSCIYLGARPLRVQPKTSPAGGQIEKHRPVKLADFPQRHQRVSFLCRSETEKDELEDQLFVKTDEGGKPLIFIPREGAAEIIHGRVPPADEALDWQREGQIWRVEFTIREDPFWLTSG